MSVKRIYCCAFCDENGHTINHCKSPKVKELIDESFRLSSLQEGEPERQFENWMKTLSLVEIKILGLQFNISLWLREKLMRQTVLKVYCLIIQNNKEVIADYVKSVDQKIQEEKEERKRKRENIISTTNIDLGRQREAEEAHQRETEEIQRREAEEAQQREAERQEAERENQREQRRLERERQDTEREQYTYDIAFQIDNDIMRIENPVLREFAMSNRNTVLHNAIRRYRYQQKNREPKFNIQIKKASIENASCDCPICYESVLTKKSIKTNCEHSFCGECVIKLLDKSNQNNHLNCPMCREKITIFTMYDNGLIDKMSKLIVC